MWRVFDQLIGTFVYFFERCENFALYYNKGFFAQKARVALGCASSYSYVFFELSELPACIHNSIYARQA